MIEHLNIENSVRSISPSNYNEEEENHVRFCTYYGKTAKGKIEIAKGNIVYYVSISIGGNIVVTMFIHRTLFQQKMKEVKEILVKQANELSAKHKKYISKHGKRIAFSKFYNFYNSLTNACGTRMELNCGNLIKYLHENNNAE